MKQCIFLFLLHPFFLLSGEFNASVSRNQVNLQEGVTLNLTLKDASEKGNPSIDLLKKEFFINSQQKSSSTVIANGKVSVSTTWRFVLISQKEGNIEIPSISIETSDGILSTQPIVIQVTKGTAAVASDSSDANDVSLVAEISNARPYKNEPVIYTAKLISKWDLANIQSQKIEVEGAIVETNGEPTIYKKVIDGVSVNVISFSYLITPSKTGVLKIPSIIVQGGIPLKRNAPIRSSSDDNFALFSAMQGFNRLKPFVLATEDLILDVQSPIAGVNPWLPVKSLKIEEIWDESQSIKEGEPFARSFKIIAEGVKASQLPSVHDLQISNNLFKIYADKPELVDEAQGNSIKSYRKEQYTLIPQQSGTLTLPEISVAWWDVTKNERAFANIPSRTLEISPISYSVSDNMPETKMTPAVERKETNSESLPMQIQKNLALYALVAGLAILLFASIFWGLILQKKNALFKEKLNDIKNVDRWEIYPTCSISDSKKKSPVKDKKEKLPDLNPT